MQIKKADGERSVSHMADKEKGEKADTGVTIS